MNNKRLLFLYIKISSGHERAAVAVIDRIKKRYPSVRIHAVDALSYLSPLLEKFVARTYLTVIKKRPFFWDRVYDNSRIYNKTINFREWLVGKMSIKFRTLVNSFSPDAVICTQAIPCAIMAYLKRTGVLKTNLIAVATDYDVHSYWMYDEIDRFFVPTVETKNKLLKQGMNGDKVVVSGIPVNSNFLRPYHKETVRKKLNLSNDSPVVLIMGGSRGIGPDENILSSLNRLPYPVQAVVIAGDNRKLEKACYRIRDNLKIDVRIHTYIENIEEYMFASDVLVTKPGGLTTTEAINVGLPMILYNPIPGQEERNAEYLVSAGVAHLAGNNEEGALLVDRFITNNLFKKEFMVSARKSSRPDAVSVIINDISGLIQTSTDNRYLEYDKVTAV